MSCPKLHVLFSLQISHKFSSDWKSFGMSQPVSWSPSGFPFVQWVLVINIGLVARVAEPSAAATATAAAITHRTLNSGSILIFIPNCNLMFKNHEIYFYKWENSFVGFMFSYVFYTFDYDYFQKGKWLLKFGKLCFT